MSAYFLRGSVPLLASLAAATLITACGGGDGDEVVDEFVSWTGSANGSVILDADNGRYKVRASDRKVQSMQDNSVLGTYTVNSNAELLRNGTVIGGVYDGVSTTGAKIVVFKCTNGRSLDIVETATAYSYTCL